MAQLHNSQLPSHANLKLVEEHFGESSEQQDFESLAKALKEVPRRVPTKYLYDQLGSNLFEDITRLDVYYQTRTEKALLKAISSRLVESCAPRELIELGSGAATKTRVLLDAMQQQGLLTKYVPFDISASVVHRTAEELTREYPGLKVHGMIGDFVHDLDHLPPGDHRLIVFLGGTIGNFDEAGAQQFLARLSQLASGNDRLLVGFDLIKPAGQIEAAYNDPQGVTAAFNRNILEVVNQAAGGNFAPEEFEHRAPYNVQKHRIEMWLKAKRAQSVSLDKIGLRFELAAGEEILTEISTKYDRSLVESLFASSQLELEQWFTDEQQLFGLALARPS